MPNSRLSRELRVSSADRGFGGGFEELVGAQRDTQGVVPSAIDACRTGTVPISEPLCAVGAGLRRQAVITRARHPVCVQERDALQPRLSRCASR